MSWPAIQAAAVSASAIRMMPSKNEAGSISSPPYRSGVNARNSPVLIMASTERSGTRPCFSDTGRPARTTSRMPSTAVRNRWPSTRARSR